MTKANQSGAFKGHRFSPEIVAYAVWSCFRFPLSLRDFEDLLAARGIITIKVALTQDGFLFGDTPCAADASLTSVLATMRATPGETLLSQRTANDQVLFSFIDRVDAALG